MVVWEDRPAIFSTWAGRRLVAITDFGTTVMNRPRAGNFARRSIAKRYQTYLRTFETASPKTPQLHGHDSMYWVANVPRLVDEFSKIDLATTRPSAVRARRNDQWIVEKNFDVQVIHRIIVGTRLRHSREDDIMCAVAKSGELEARRQAQCPRA